jgi:hypothetical protein
MSERLLVLAILIVVIGIPLESPGPRDSVRRSFLAFFSWGRCGSSLHADSRGQSRGGRAGSTAQRRCSWR